MHQPLSRLLLIFLAFLLFYAFHKDILARLKKPLKRHMVIAGCILLFVVLFAITNILLNGICPFVSKTERPLPDVKQFQCITSCYCDGVKIQNQCLGAWRKICVDK